MSTLDKLGRKRAWDTTESKSSVAKKRPRRAVLHTVLVAEKEIAKRRPQWRDLGAEKIEARLPRPPWVGRARPPLRRRRISLMGILVRNLRRPKTRNMCVRAWEHAKRGF